MGGSVSGGANGGTWSGGAGSWNNANDLSNATYTASSSESGSVPLTITTSGGSCGSITDTKSINVIIAPNAGTITGNNSITIGNSTTLASDGDVGGTWSSSNTSFATVNSSSGEVLGVADGIAIISYTVSNAPCSDAVSTFNISVGSSSVCNAPTNLSASNISTSSADLSWIAGGIETVWELTWGPQGFATGTGTLVPMLTNNSYNLTGLSASTSYDFYVKADCGFSSGTTNLSIWAGPYNFTSKSTGPTNKTYVPDDNFEAYLESNGMGDGIANNDSVLTSGVFGITSLDVSNQNISDLTSIEDFTSLVSLNCKNNSLTSLDISQNTSLRNLNCRYNQIGSLDVSLNTNLV
jgi:hypothetical protein